MNQALQQVFPFALEQATGPGTQDVLAPQGLSVSEFENFLREVMGGESPSIGQSLRTAADFLRSPNWNGGVFSPQQDFIRRMLEEEGEVGSARFTPTIALVTQPSGRRFGIDLSQGLRQALEDSLASDPLRFQTLAEFLDYLAAQGVI
jgi:hypothetical protein